LLVTEFVRSSAIALGAFWARRARRLLPALFVLVATIGIYYAVAGPTEAIPGLKGDGIATLLYYSNWHQIAAGTSYFAASGPVSPLQHTWSLAIGLSLLRLRPAPAVRVEPARARTRVLSLGSVLVLAAVLVTIGLANGSAAWLYPYGLVALDGAVVVLIWAAVRVPAALGARVLGWAPLRALGQVSYGLYLWHFPLFEWLDESSTGISGARLVGLRLGVTLAVSVVCYLAIEQPIRQRRRPIWLVRGLAPLAAGGAVASLLLASAADSLPVGVPAAATISPTPGAAAGH